MFRAIDGPLAQLYDVYEDDEYVHLVMEMCEEIELEDMSEKQARKIMRKLFSFIKCLEGEGIAFGGLTIKNFMMKNGSIRMIDLGTASYRNNIDDFRALRKIAFTLLTRGTDKLSLDVSEHARDFLMMMSKKKTLMKDALKHRWISSERTTK